VAKEGGILMLPEPYFMTNKEWYYFDEEAFMYKLTDKAPKKAQESYKEFYDELNSMRD
jgi:hypothetical protein